MHPEGRERPEGAKEKKKRPSNNVWEFFYNVCVCVCVRVGEGERNMLSEVERKMSLPAVAWRVVVVVMVVVW